MAQSAIFAIVAAAVIATLGLWWFRVVLSNVKKLAPTTRYGVYALIWLAYFIATLVLVGQTGQS